MVYLFSLSQTTSLLNHVDYNLITNYQNVYWEAGDKRPLLLFCIFEGSAMPWVIESLQMYFKNCPLQKDSAVLIKYYSLLHL